MVREHSQLLGDHFIQEIYEIAGDVSPSDFPLVDDPDIELAVRALDVGLDEVVSACAATACRSLIDAASLLVVFRNELERLRVQRERVLLAPSRVPPGPRP